MNHLSCLHRAGRLLLGVLVLALFATPSRAQTGHVLNGVGPLDQGMAGAGMAAPQDALTALHWNPASITTLDGTWLDVSLQLLIPTGDLASSVDQGAFGPMGPGTNLSGRTPSEAGPFPIPALGFVRAAPTSRWAFGFSAFGVGGFGVDHEMDPNAPINPVLLPQPPNGMGFGNISSEFALLQLSPTFAYRLTDRLSIGVAPTLNYATLKVAPFPAAAPDDANGDGFPSYATAPKDGTLGFGVQVGLHLSGFNGFHAGISLKSTQRFDRFAFDTVDEMGAPRTIRFGLDYPMIVSAGVSYTGLDRWLLAADVRYIDFAHTEGFDQSGFDATGAVQGFGWNSIVATAFGLQYELTPRLPVRVGYAYNESPITGEVSFFNAPSPAIIQHHLAGGLSYALTRTFTASFALQYGVKNEVEGPWQHPQLGAIEGTQAACELATLTFIFGVHVDL